MSKQTGISAIVVLLGLLVALPSESQVLEWVNPGLGDWDEAANWSDTPNTFATRSIDNGGTAQKRSIGPSLPTVQIGETLTGTLHILAPGTLDSTRGRIGGPRNESFGEVLIAGSGAKWTVSDGLIVGISGLGKLDLRDRASLATRVSFALGWNGSARGELAVTGASVLETDEISIGLGGSGVMKLTGGSRATSDTVTMGSASSAVAEVLLADGGSVWEVSGPIVIADSGSAKVSVESGAHLSARSATLALRDLSNGSLVLRDGASSTFPEFFAVGLLGTGTLSVDSSTLVSGNSTLGWGVLSKGVVNLRGTGAIWAVHGDLKLATSGLATLVVEDGGQLTSESVLMADWESAGADVLVRGSESVWRTGNLTVGRAGTASLDVRDGGRVEASASVLVGLSHMGSASIEVTGPGSELNVTDAFVLGFSNPVTLTIGNGGRVSASHSELRSEMAVATATVVGAGSLWETGSAFEIGNNGTARLFILEGATAVSENARAGISSRGPSDIVIDGTGSSWRVQHSFLLGFLGTGNLTVRNGARLELGSIDAAGTLELGESFGATGSINIGGGNAPGFLRVARVVGGEGIARVTFEHTSPTYALTPDGTDFTSPVIVEGSTSIEHIGIGKTTLLGNHSYTGATSVSRGTLEIEGSIISPTTITGPGILGGSGVVHASVTVGGGGTVAPGSGVGVLSVDSLSLDSQARLNFQLSRPGAISDRIDVDGAVILDGMLNISDVGGLGFGEYELIRFGGALIDRGLEIDSLPPGYDTTQVRVDTATPGIVKLVVSESAIPEGPTQASLFFVNPASNTQQQSFVRIVNPNPEPLDVLITAFDDEGTPAPGGPVTTTLAPQSSLQFTSQDLESGNPSKGLNGRLGDGAGKWQLIIDGTLPFEAMSLIRTPDGFLTNVSELAPAAGGTHEVYFANPPGNTVQQSFIRVVNRSTDSGTVIVSAVDDAGNPSPEGPVSFGLGPNAALSFNSADYSFGNVEKGLVGGFGLGTGKWRLTIESTLDLAVMSLIRNPDGFVTNVSTVVPPLDGQSENRLLLSVDPSRLPDRAGFVRLLNPGAVSEVITLTALDDDGRAGAQAVEVELAAFSAVQLVAEDFESGNPAKRISGGFGAGSGRWHIDAQPIDRVEAMSLMRLPGGFLSNLSAVAPQSSPTEAAVWFFNPAQNQDQRSVLRIVNRDDAPGAVLIKAIDDTGAEASGGSVIVTLPPLAAVELSAADLEEGNPDLGVEGALGAGVGKWRLHIEADVGIHVQNLLESPGGFLTDLSRPAARN